MVVLALPELVVQAALHLKRVHVLLVQTTNPIWPLQEPIEARSHIGAGQPECADRRVDIEMPDSTGRDSTHELAILRSCGVH